MVKVIVLYIYFKEMDNGKLEAGDMVFCFPHKILGEGGQP